MVESIFFLSTLSKSIQSTEQISVLSRRQCNALLKMTTVFPDSLVKLSLLTFFV